MAAKVPAVPGAFGESPLPKPKANNSVGERNNCVKDGLARLLAKVIVPLFIDRYWVVVKVENRHQIT